MTLHLDFETFSEQDIRKVGAERYSEDPSTMVLMAGSARNRGRVEVQDTDLQSAPFLDRVRAGEPIAAHNAGFERNIWNDYCVPVLGWPEVPTSQWRCTAAQAAALGLPRSLDGALKALGAPIEKNKSGTRLINLFCKPQKDGRRVFARDAPEKWDQFLTYNEEDVVGEQWLDERLPALSSDEQKVYELDALLNSRGIPVDVDLIRQAIRQVQDIDERLQLRCLKLTGLRASQRDRILEWLQEKGCKLDTLDEQSIERELKKDHPDKVLEVLELRLEVARAGVKKLTTMLECVCHDGMVRGTHLYHGASTGRWSSLRVQVHNLPKGKVEAQEQTIQYVEDGILHELRRPLSALSKSIRGFLRARHVFLCADYSAIEARVLAWMAGEEWLIRAFRNGEDPYCIMASAVFGRHITKADEFERFIGKQLVLGCGYGMGPPKFIMSCAKWGVTVELPFSKKSVYAYRDKNKKIVGYWKEIEKAACRAVRTGKSQLCGLVRFFVKDIWLFCELPSGRCLAYPFPEVHQKMTPWGEPTDELSFMGVWKGKWVRETTYGGKLVENIVQAVSRDIMVNGMQNAEADGFPIVMTVHDEVITDTPFENDLNDFIFALTRLPKWARGLPIAAEGFPAKRYAKR